MLGSKNHLFCDRKIYSYKGKWQDPKQDLPRNIFYFINSSTLVETFEHGREQLKPQITITAFGELPIAENDVITLQTGETYRVNGFTFNYIESNILVRDMLKQRVESMVLVLE